MFLDIHAHTHHRQDSVCTHRALCSCCYSDIYRPHSEELSYCRSRGTGAPHFAFSFSRKFLLKKQKGCEQQNTTLMANQCNIFLLATFSAFMCTYGPCHLWTAITTLSPHRFPRTPWQCLTPGALPPYRCPGHVPSPWNYYSTNTHIFQPF